MKFFLNNFKKIAYYLSISMGFSIVIYILRLIYEKNKTVKAYINSVAALWNYPIYAEASLTLGKLFLALSLITFGFWLSKLLSEKVFSFLIDKTKLEYGAKASIKNLSYYIFVLIFALIALRLAEVPLTIFTVFGGALAIAAGFGSQTILQNFMSGIIVQVEQTIKVGDIVEIDSIQGTVQDIRGRSTKILAADNTHTIIPNSDFVNKKFINWTLTDKIVRSCVRVGLHYKTDPKIAQHIIEDTLKVFDNIKKSPRPRIIFTDFGDNSLNFKVYFWSACKNILDREELESHFRFALFKALKENKIEIPYPQRTISWDSPLTLKTQGGGNDEDSNN